MGSEVFYPYAVAAERLTLDVGAPPDVPRGQDDVLKVFQWEEDTLPLAMTVGGVSEVLPDVLPKAELADPPVQVYVLYESVEGRRREGYRLSQEAGGFGLDISLDLKDQAGEVLVQAVVVRSAPSHHETSGRATDRGARLAWSPVHRIQFDEPRMPPGNFIEVEWRDFSQAGEWLKRYSHHIFALEMAGPAPRLLLNRSFSPEIHRILSSTGTHGPMARIRDATFQMIVHQVWSSLLAEALHEVRELSLGTDITEAEALLQDANEWKANVLRSWATYLAPDEEPDTALQAIMDDVQAAGIDDLLLRSVPSAIQQRFRTYRGFSGLVQELMGG